MPIIPRIGFTSICANRCRWAPAPSATGFRASVPADCMPCVPASKGVDCATLSVLDLRRKLLELEGVGPKTASWIVRNLLGTDEVAILDIHVLRACQAMQLFPDAVSLPRDYVPLEKRFLAFASAIAVRASILDMVMWVEMRRGRSALAV